MYIDFLNKKLELLNSKQLSFRDFIYEIKQHSEDNSYPIKFFSLLRDSEFFRELINNNLLSKLDLKYLFNKIETLEDIIAFNNWNSFLKQHLIKNKIVSFKDLVDKYKSIKDNDGDSMLYLLLSNNNEVFYFIDNDLLDDEALRYIFKNLESFQDLSRLEDSPVLYRALSDKVVEFKEVVELYKTIKDKEGFPSIYRLLDNNEFFEYCIEKNLLKKRDVQALLSEVNDILNAHLLCKNFPLILYCFKNFLIDKKLVKKFDKIIQQEEFTTFFEKVKNAFLPNDSELIESYKLLYALSITNKEKQELFELIQSSEKALNNLTLLIENNLYSQYDFEKLKEILIKDDKKKKFKLNL